MEYPNRLRLLRDAQKLNQKQIASHLGIHQAEYGRMENGKRRIGRHADALSEILKCDPNDLITVAGVTAATDIDFMDCFALPDESGGILFDLAMSTKVPRPTVMKDRPKGFCMMAPSNEMEPTFKMGDLCFCDPEEQVTDDDFCVVKVQKGNRVLGLIKKHLGANVFVTSIGGEEKEFGEELIGVAPILSVIYAR